MNNVKLLHIKCCFFSNFSIVWWHRKKSWSPKKKLKWRHCPLWCPLTPSQVFMDPHWIIQNTSKIHCWPLPLLVLPQIEYCRYVVISVISHLSAAPYKTARNRPANPGEDENMDTTNLGSNCEKTQTITFHEMRWTHIITFKSTHVQCSFILSRPGASFEGAGGRRPPPPPPPPPKEKEKKKEKKKKEKKEKKRRKRKK